jgi:hypothetical protein
VPYADNLAVVIEIEERLPGTLFHFAGTIGKNVEAFDPELEGFPASRGTFKELLLSNLNSRLQQAEWVKGSTPFIVMVICRGIS